MKFWVVNGMDCKPLVGTLQDVVVKIFWTRQANEMINGIEYVAQIHGSYICPPVDLNDFIPYQDLTKEEVDSWLNTGINVQPIDSKLDIQIENQVNPPIVQLPLPWVPTPTPSPTSTAV